MIVSGVLDEKGMNNVGFAMECIAFSDDDLDACLADMRQILDQHVPEHAEIDPDSLRIVVAQGLAMAGALKNIHHLHALESLLLTVGFFGDMEVNSLFLIKIITLDQAMNEAIRIEIEGNNEQSSSDCAQLEQVRCCVKEVILSRGIAHSYYKSSRGANRHER